jgi:hypothetical protein
MRYHAKMRYILYFFKKNRGRINIIQIIYIILLDSEELLLIYVK